MRLRVGFAALAHHAVVNVEQAQRHVSREAVRAALGGREGAAGVPSLHGGGSGAHKIIGPGASEGLENGWGRARLRQADGGERGCGTRVWTMGTFKRKKKKPVVMV